MNRNVCLKNVSTASTTILTSDNVNVMGHSSYLNSCKWTDWNYSKIS